MLCALICLKPPMKHIRFMVQMQVPAYGFVCMVLVALDLVLAGYCICTRYPI